jgi:hypothetical protein
VSRGCTTTYIFGGEDGCNAQGEQDERRPLEVDHCAGFQEEGKGDDGRRERRRRGWLGVLERSKILSWSLEESMS